MTVYLSLILLVSVSLFFGMVNVARLTACRACAACALDEAMFSLFSCYDRDLFSEYDVFFLDAGTSDESKLLHQLRFLKDSSSYVLHPGKGVPGLFGKELLSFDEPTFTIDGYVNAGHGNGAVFADAAVSQAKATIGIQGVQLLIDQCSGIIDTAEENGKQVSTMNMRDHIREIKKQATQETDPAVETPASVELPNDYTNPLDTLLALRSRTLFDLVLPEGTTLSQASLPADRPGTRQLAPSLGVADLPSLAGGDHLYLLSYILSHTGCFTTPKEGGLQYELEYILTGKPGDRDALRSTLHRLLYLRTGVNIACILTDSMLRAEAKEAALLAATALLLPEIAPALEALLIAGWSYGESLLDLRALLGGHRIALKKTYQDWMLRIENLPLLLSDPDSLIAPSSSGLSYRDHLAAFLLLSRKDLPLRMMDVAEHGIRMRYDRPSFRLDACLDTLTVTMSVTAEEKKTLQVSSRYSYREDRP